MSVFTDLSKAFDTVDHAILLKKLELYGIKCNIHNYIKSYISSSTQYVDMETFLWFLRAEYWLSCKNFLLNKRIFIGTLPYFTNSLKVRHIYLSFERHKQHWVKFLLWMLAFLYPSDKYHQPVYGAFWFHTLDCKLNWP